MKVELSDITIKNKEGKSISITWDEARTLKDRLCQIFPDYYWRRYYHEYPNIWWSGNYSSADGKYPTTEQIKTSIDLSSD